jgi:DNA-binding IclR family transcriptional regulator
VLDKAMAVLSALEDGPKNLTELMAATELPRATAHRLAVALEHHGLARRDSEGRFALGYRLVALGRRAAGADRLRQAASVPLEALARATGESVQLYVRDGEERVCVLSIESTHELRTIVAEGARLPLDRGSAGKVLSGGSTGPWVESVGERQAGVASVSAPVREFGSVVAAVSVSGPVDRFGGSPGQVHGAAVVVAAREIQAFLETEHDAPARPVP